METLELMPKVLYKYRNSENEWNLKTLFDFEIYLASTSQFNDPYEGSIPFRYEPTDLTPENIFLKLRELAKKDYPDWKEDEIHKYCFESHQKNLFQDEAHIERENQKNRIEINKMFGILSLTIHPLNYLMWSHYANSHKGFCLGFDTKILYDIVGTIGPVTYLDELPRLRLFGDAMDFHKKQLATKSTVWRYEGEFRLVKIRGSRETIRYPMEMLKQIYLGCKMVPEMKSRIIEFVISHEINCEIFDLSLDDKIFKLNSLQIY
jgi:hypothetical protein